MLFSPLFLQPIQVKVKLVPAFILSNHYFEQQGIGPTTLHSNMKTDVAGRGQYYRDSSSMEVEMQLGNLTASPTPEADIDMDYELNSPRSINDSYDLGSAPQSRSPSPVFEAYDLGSAPQSRSPSPATGEYDLGPIPQFHAPSPGLEYDLGFPPQSRAVSPAFIDIDYDLGSPIHSPSISPGFDGIDPSAILPEYDLGSPLPEGHDGSTFITFENPSETIMNEQALEYLPDRIRVQTQLLYKRRHAISQFREMTADVGQILLRAEALAQSASMDEVEHQIDSNPLLWRCYPPSASFVMSHMKIASFWTSPAFIASSHKAEPKPV
ncbi:hypothetical protein A0H81_11419 [Grifola frondosa]|uniref:Uncharacterized protein n=1 Tax=Grifola frondosa TaxID=5627 RepID=A0A1C7LVY9_GRIFR|nr:hypothetical protein A0H81_11419 [Grifola frondosa]